MIFFGFEMSPWLARIIILCFSLVTGIIWLLSLAQKRYGDAFGDFVFFAFGWLCYLLVKSRNPKDENTR